MKLEEALQECTLALLRRIAGSHSIPVAEDTLRAELAAAIGQRFADEDYVRQYVAALPEDEKEAVRFLASHEWAGKAFLLERQFARRPTGGEGATPSPCISLLQQGVLYRGFGAIGTWRGELFHIPEELRPAISASLPPEQDLPAPSVAASAAPASVEWRNAGFELFCLLSFLRRGERRSYQGFLSRFDLPKLEQEANPSAREADLGDAERRWRFILHLALAGGWVRRDGYLLKPGRTAAQVLSGSVAEVRQRIVERYLKDRAWSDLEQAGRVRQSLGSRRVDEAAGRQMLLHYLEELVGEEWVGEEAFCEAVRGANPDFLREDYASLSWAMVDVGAEAEVYGEASWDLVEGEWLRYVLRGPLYWLGIVRWGRNRDGKRVAFRVAGADSGDDELLPLMAGPAAISVRDDLSVSAPNSVDLGLLYQLEPYLALKGRDPGGSGYRFNRASVLHGLEAGGNWEELRGLLTKLASTPIPAAIEGQLAEWAAAYGRLSLEGGVVLTAASEQEAAELAQQLEIAPLLAEPLGPRGFRVAPDRVWQLIEALREAGHAPRVEPSVGTQRARGAAADVALLQESLFALLVLRALHGSLEMEDGAEAQRRIEAALDPDSVAAVSKRAQDAVKRMRARGDVSGW